MPSPVPASCQQQGLLPNGVPAPALYVAVSPQYYFNGHACGCSIQYRSAPGSSVSLFTDWITATLVSSLDTLPAEGLGIGLFTGIPDGAVTAQWRFSGNCNGLDFSAPNIAQQSPANVAAPAPVPPPVAVTAPVTPSIVLSPLPPNPPTPPVVTAPASPVPLEQLTPSPPPPVVTPPASPVPLEQLTPSPPPPVVVPPSPPSPATVTVPIPSSPVPTSSPPPAIPASPESPPLTSTAAINPSVPFVGEFFGDGTYYVRRTS